MYAKFFKRLIDFTLSLIALIVLFPLLLVLTIVGAVAMKGNPFFVQPRPGKKGKDGKEKIFKLIKFRTMSNAKDKEGNLLPDEIRLNKYGRFLRSTSLDELPELINILKGDMSFIGPRPHLATTDYESLDEKRKKRLTVRPGITGYSQAYYRNSADMDKKIDNDCYYAENVSFLLDLKIIFKTMKTVITGKGVYSQDKR